MMRPPEEDEAARGGSRAASEDNKKPFSTSFEAHHSGTPKLSARYFSREAGMRSAILAAVRGQLDAMVAFAQEHDAFKVNVRCLLKDAAEKLQRDETVTFEGHGQ